MNYQRQLHWAHTMLNATNDDYWRGYIKGLYRARFGDYFGDPDEHRALERRQDLLGTGYRAGLAFQAC